MVDEKDDQFEGHEESEYHFSDEQMNYEMEESAAPEEQKPSPPKQAPLGNVGSNRRYIIGGVAFFILIYVVYKIMSPSATTTPGEITQVGAPAKPVATVATRPQMNAQASRPAPAASQMASQAQMQVSPAPTVTQPASTAAVSTMPQVQQPPMVMANMPSTNNPQVDIKTILDKLDALSQQNSKMAYALGTEYPQKFSSYEEKNQALQAKVEDLTNRIATLETNLNQLTQTLQEGARSSEGPPSPPLQMNSSQSMPPPRPVESRPAEPRINYTVQAIIPGRAWLKSDSGDTITIAEGDILKDLGRVSKIDPYDGVVEVDTGTKVVTLTYGG